MTLRTVESSRLVDGEKIDLIPAISALSGAGGKFVKVKTTEDGWEYGVSGAGDVTGPSSSGSNNIVIFDGVSGKLIKDGWKTLPSGDIVGTSDTQTLTNKTIAISNNTIQAAFANAALATQGTTEVQSVALSASQLLGRGSSGDISAISLGTALSMSGSTLDVVGGGGRTKIQQQRVWTDAFTVARTDGATLTYTASSNDEATTIANALEGKLFRIDNGDGTGFFKAWIASATASTTTVTINLNGETIPASGATSNDSDLATARVSISRVAEKWELHIPGQQITDASNPQGKRHIPQEDIFLFSTNGYLGTAASGAGADCQYNIYDDGSALYGTAPSFGTNASVKNQIPTTFAVAGDSIVNLRVLAAAGATTPPQNLVVNLYYAPQSVFTLP